MALIHRRLSTHSTLIVSSTRTWSQHNDHNSVVRQPEELQTTESAVVRIEGTQSKEVTHALAMNHACACVCVRAKEPHITD